MPFVSVAVSDHPEGPYEYLGKVKKPNGTVVGLGKHDVFMFDPGVLKDEDGRVYLYAGFGPADDGPLGFVCSKYRMNGAYVCELEQDMLTIKSDPHLLVPKAGHESDAPDFNSENTEEDPASGILHTKESSSDRFKGHGFYEACSMRKVGNKYYFIYSSNRSHELCYAVSDFPDRRFEYGGTLVSNADVGVNGNTVFRNYTGKYTRKHYSCKKSMVRVLSQTDKSVSVCAAGMCRKNLHDRERSFFAGRNDKLRTGSGTTSGRRCV